ncbi:MAG: DUF4838 domain-containing protein [Armatimonadota bacterium]
MRSLCRWLLLLGACLPAAAALADVTLVENGVPKATIVIAKEAVGAPTEPAEKDVWNWQPAPNKIAAAALDLQVYIEKMTGAKLPIVGDDAAPQGNLVLVGRSALTKDFNDRIPAGQTADRAEEGYAIITRGNRLLLAGNDEPCYHGTEYAVAAFLHKQGVRWYMPGDYGEVVPKKATIVADVANVVSRPDFKMRNWWGPQASDMRAMEYRWKIRNGMNPVLDFVTLPRDSSIRGVLPPEKEIDNPEYADIFAKDATGKPYPHMPNLTSEKSVQYAAEKIKTFFREHPEITFYGLGGDDGYPRDYSPGTLKRSLGFPDTGGRVGVASDMSTTEEWMEWVQKVAAAVYKEFPNHRITTNGYANRNVPPIGIKSDPEIWIMFAAIWSDTMHAYDNPRSWMTLRQADMIESWAKQYKNVYMYNYIYYMLAGCGAPIPLAHKTARDMPLYKKWGVVGFSDEGRVVRGESGIFPTYLRARMMWDANLDVRKEMNEFFTTWYGPAAGPATAFWEELERTFETTTWLGHEDRILPYVYSDALVQKLEKYVAEAEAAATDGVYRQHVSADRVVLEHLKAFMAMNRAEFNADFAEAAKQAQRMVDVRKPATALSRWYFDPNPTSGESYGFYYWGSVSRQKYYQQMADLTTGKAGETIAVLPEKAKFKIDPRDDGRYQGWYDPELKDGTWQTISTTMPFYAQGYTDAQGYPYMGAMWYRLKVDVPKSAAGRKVFLYCPAVETEAWVWVNGQLIGHREYHEAYERPNAIDMDVTAALQPGKSNSVVIRVQTGTSAAAMAGGIVSRLLLYAPKQ